MFQILAVVIVLATPAEGYHLDYVAQTTTGKPLIRAAIRCIKNDGYFEVRAAQGEADQFVYVSCYLPNPIEPVIEEQVVIEGGE